MATAASIVLLCSACSTVTVGPVEHADTDGQRGWVLGSLLLASSRDAPETAPIETGPPSRHDYTLLARRGPCSAPGVAEYAWELQWGRERLFALNLPAGSYRFCGLVRRGSGERRASVPLAFEVQPAAQSYVGRIVLSPPSGSRGAASLRVQDDLARARPLVAGLDRSEGDLRVALARRTRNPRNTGVCSELARTFRLVAQQRDRGESREDQIRMVERSVSSPFVTRPERTLDHLLRVVDYVYLDYSDSSAGEIESSVLDSCVVNERGQAVLRRLQPVH